MCASDQKQKPCSTCFAPLDANSLPFQQLGSHFLVPLSIWNKDNMYCSVYLIRYPYLSNYKW